MAYLKIDGNSLKESGSNNVLARVDGNFIKKAGNNAPLVRIDGNLISKASSNDILARMDDVKKSIQGATGKITDVAFWLLFAR